MYGVIEDVKGKFKFGPHQITKIDKEFDRNDKGKYIWRREFSDTKISVVPLNRPDDYHFTMEVSTEGKIVLSWKGVNGESLPTEQEFRHCQLMLRAWRDRINEAIESNENSIKEAEANREIFENKGAVNNVGIIKKLTLSELSEIYLRNLKNKSSNNYRRGYSHSTISAISYLDKKASHNVLSYLKEKTFLDTHSGKGDSVVITANGIDYIEGLDQNKSFRILQFISIKKLPTIRSGFDFIIEFKVTHEDDSVTDHTLKIGISTILVAMWRHTLPNTDLGQSEMEIIQSVLVQIAKEHIQGKIRTGTLPDHEELDLKSSNSSSECPVGPEKLVNISEAEYVIELQKESNLKTEEVSITTSPKTSWWGESLGLPSTAEYDKEFERLIDKRMESAEPYLELLRNESRVNLSMETLRKEFRKYFESKSNVGDLQIENGDLAIEDNDLKIMPDVKHEDYKEFIMGFKKFVKYMKENEMLPRDTNVKEIINHGNMIVNEQSNITEQNVTKTESDRDSHEQKPINWTKWGAIAGIIAALIALITLLIMSQ